MSSKKKKIIATTTAVILVLALGLAGTFAASSGDHSDGGFGEDVNTKLSLHDDFATTWADDVRDRDIYVENTGDTSLYVRIRLDEFMRYGNKSIISGGKQDVLDTWTPHKVTGTDVSECSTGIHDYFTLQMGNDAGVKYKPGIKNSYNPALTEADKTATTSKAQVVTIDEYLNATDKPGPCWVLDDDGYAYWHRQLKKTEATGLILNSITNTGLIDESYYYGINAKAEAVTEMDLNAWFNGSTPTDGEKEVDQASKKAVKLLKKLSPKYIEITDEMAANGAKDYDSDNDGYLTKQENAEYEAEKGVTSNPTPEPETGIKVDGSNFPDSNLLSEVKKQDTDNSGDLSKQEIAAVTSLDLSGTGITDYTGLENFTALTDLNVSNNGLTQINFLSRTPKLTTLDCSNNNLTSLNLSKGALTKVLEALTEERADTQLINANCSDNQLTSLDLSTAPGLTTLNCSNNKLTKLDISGNALLANITATGQTTTVNVTYDKTTKTYKGGSNLFVTGTTFGVSDAVYDSSTGGVTLTTLTNEKTSTYSLALMYSGSQKGTLSGTITFTGMIYVNPVVEAVKNTAVGGTVKLANKEGSQTEWLVYNKTTSEADLITKDPVATRQFHASELYPGWLNSDIRKWLNDGTSGYKSQLSDEMKAAIKAQSLMTASAFDNWTSTQSSTDEIYLLTETKLDSGKVGKTIGATTTLTTEQLKCSGSNWWWLRSPRTNSTNAGFVNTATGEVGRSNVDYTLGFTRPALTLGLQ